VANPDPTHIHRAVIPAAGHGTRLRPLTNIAPKVLLPLGRKPTVEYIVEELHAAGINDIIFVVSAQDTKVQEYFGDSACDGAVRMRYVVQREQLGLAHAILCAEEAVEGEHFAVALGDSVILSRQQIPPFRRMLAAYAANPAFTAITVERVAIEDSYKYGMVKPIGQIGDESFEIAGLVEKPKPEDSPSNYAIGGRYVFDPGIFDVIRKTLPGTGGELQITDSIALSMTEGKRVWCTPVIEGEHRYDMGNSRTYCEAFVAMCLIDPELAPYVERAFERR
jgi:UTP--glucose-1-phosphate uridylyltransferase